MKRQNNEQNNQPQKLSRQSNKAVGEKGGHACAYTRKNYWKTPLNVKGDPFRDFPEFDTTYNVYKKRLPQGMLKEFENVTRKLSYEKLDFYEERNLMAVDIDMVEAKVARKVRRIVEKRMCQECHNRGKREKGRLNAYKMNRATAFQLHNMGGIDYQPGMHRDKSTHWKKVYDPIVNKVVFKKKFGYKTELEAEEAAEKQMRRHPEDPRPVHAYKCDYCGKWHIGHFTPDSEKMFQKKNLQSVGQLAVSYI